ncbi:hypothetical protein CBM2637_U20005 [Cupriavidus taiwanensis]|nr:hypothetical protein CBM2637_U20005 [Cupriavidus taiwanensis]
MQREDVSRKAFGPAKNDGVHVPTIANLGAGGAWARHSIWTVSRNHADSPSTQWRNAERRSTSGRVRPHVD